MLVALVILVFVAASAGAIVETAREDTRYCCWSPPQRRAPRPRDSRRDAPHLSAKPASDLHRLRAARSKEAMGGGIFICGCEDSARWPGFL